jgi:hypothetical protein
MSLSIASGDKGIGEFQWSDTPIRVLGQWPAIWPFYSTQALGSEQAEFLARLEYLGFAICWMNWAVLGGGLLFRPDGGANVAQNY